MTDAQQLQTLIVDFVRAFGLHDPDQTPCGQPVSVSEAHALMELSKGQALRQKNLADLLRLEKSTVSRLVDKLEKRGWVERVTDPDDGRAILMRLTDAGITRSQRIQAARTETFSNLMQALQPGEHDAVATGLTTLVNALNRKNDRADEISA